MTQAREPLNIMDGNPPNCDFSKTTKRGVYISKSLAFVILIIFTLALVATSFIVYNFAACPRTDQLANVTKYELTHTHCEHDHDHSRFAVLPISTEHSKSVVSLETTANPVVDTTADDTATITDVRLPNNIKPDTYYLKLTPYIYDGNFTFDGEISIEITVKKDTNKVTFHGVELTFLRIDLYEKKNKRPVKIIRRTEDVPRQFHILMLGETIKANNQFILNITYNGILNDNLHGFYRSSYEIKNVTR